MLHGQLLRSEETSVVQQASILFACSINYSFGMANMSQEFLNEEEPAKVACFRENLMMIRVMQPPARTIVPFCCLYRKEVILFTPKFPLFFEGFLPYESTLELQKTSQLRCELCAIWHFTSDVEIVSPPQLNHQKQMRLKATTFSYTLTHTN